jgi:hypothetical protein
MPVLDWIRLVSSKTYKLQVTSYELQVTSYELQVGSPNSTSYILNSTLTLH